MLSTAIVLALIFLVVAILAIGKMHDAQREKEQLKTYIKNLELDWESVENIINDKSLSDSEKVQLIWELL